MKKPRLFYYEESESAFVPAPKDLDCIIDVDNFSEDGEKIDIQFVMFMMEDEEMENLPEN